MAEPLSDRSQRILEAIIEEHIATAQPIGSKTLTRFQAIRLSPASVRNVMAELEDLGFLHSPHTSAGRVPTEKAYRYYVDSLLRIDCLDRERRDQLEQHYHRRGLQMAELLREASRALSSVAHYTGLVMVPRLQSTVFRRIEFVRLSPRQVLAVFITQSGLIQNRLIETSEEFTAAELEQITNYLNRAMQGLSIREARALILAEMAQEKALYDRLLQRAFRLSAQALAEQGDDEVIIEGTSHLLDQPEFTDLERMKRIFRAFEQKSLLLSLLDRGLQAKGVQVIIGGEIECPELAGCSLITASYSGPRGTLGALGVIGPSRMPYSTLIPIVDYTAGMISRMLDEELE
ncbi:MAG: heat-inducible transcription repressor HrcA [Deltaproteobacteria bacterium]|nr:MAG: heat-inducible transcription repressor HrcA [Deltaproteobacteria bacterium]